MTISMCQCFFYADDGLLLARSYEEAEEMIQMVVEVAGECELKINNGKSNVLLFNCKGVKPDEVGGVRFGKSTHISMISNSVTRLRSYTNSAIAGNSA